LKDVLATVTARISNGEFEAIISYFNIVFYVAFCCHDVFFE